MPGVHRSSTCLVRVGRVMRPRGQRALSRRRECSASNVGARLRELFVARANLFAGGAIVGVDSADLFADRQYLFAARAELVAGTPQLGAARTNLFAGCTNIVAGWTILGADDQNLGATRRIIVVHVPRIVAG